MIDLREFPSRLRACAAGESIDDLEEWFDSSSWNVHQENNQTLIDLVFYIESLFSAHLDGRMSDEAIRVEFANLANSLEYPAAENRFGDPYPVSGYSSGSAINVAA